MRSFTTGVTVILGFLFVFKESNFSCVKKATTKSTHTMTRKSRVYVKTGNVKTEGKAVQNLKDYPCTETSMMFEFLK